MDNSIFEQVLKDIDQKIDAIGDAKVGIKLGWELYREFRQRDLLTWVEIKSEILWDWKVPTYRQQYILDDRELADTDYRIGSSHA